MLGIERRQIITSILQKNKKVLVSDLRKQFNVTEETIRRDLEKLEREGALTRTYGGAVINQPTNLDLPFNQRIDINLQIKQEIAQKASLYISDNDSLFVDSSSTCFELVKLLNDKRNVTVITNSVKILNERSNTTNKIISTGGELVPHSLSLVGAISLETAKKYNPDYAILSCNGLDQTKGIMDSNEPDAELKKFMAQQANKNILLADHTKFDNIAFISFLEFQKIDYLITNIKPSDNWIKFLHENNITVIY
ncbi:DeoR/GlpR family DNA-binding transcription regulator [Neobacillus dielmonensis]|uniref:DeoR/GlpR family DNA-binding transcription regulator n=1 Tax=Neobacillus dielmonensis TaxID=1347369 RepID=UPI0005A70D63|nr:DeoR/GlpR family DNA-binding transcription regulator [Neobacillus dielmonensis]